MVAALRTRFEHGLVPDHEVAGRIVLAPKKRLAARLGSALGDFSIVLRAAHTGRHGPSATALGELGAAKKIAASAVTYHHGLAALLALVVRELHRLLLARHGAGVVTVLWVFLARHEGAEEAPLGQEFAPALGTALGLQLGQIVRLANERSYVDMPQRLLERGPEIAQHATPFQGPVLDFIEFPFHLRREADVEDIGELLDHHLFHAFA